MEQCVLGSLLEEIVGSVVWELHLGPRFQVRVITCTPLHVFLIDTTLDDENLKVLTSPKDPLYLWLSGSGEKMVQMF